MDSASYNPQYRPQGAKMPLGDVQVSLPSPTPAPEEKKPWWDFLTAPRFWALILGALSVYLEAKGWVGEPERNLIATITTIFIGISTYDKTVTKLAKN